MEAEADGDIDTQNTIDISMSITTGSADTTTAQICLSLDTLARHPEQRAELVRNTELLPNAVTELMCFRPGMLSTPRVATDSAGPLAGVGETDADTIYRANIEAAKQGPVRLRRPDALDLTRDLRGGMPVNSGSGRHGCLGQALSLTEQEEVLRPACGDGGTTASRLSLRRCAGDALDACRIRRVGAAGAVAGSMATAHGRASATKISQPPISGSLRRPERAAYMYG